MDKMTLNGFKYMLAQTPMMRNQTGEQIKFFLMMALVLVVMWVLMIAPQRKKAKEQDAMLKTLKPGDRIVTASGIIAVVLSVKDKSVNIRSADTKLEILKSAIAEVTVGESSVTDGGSGQKGNVSLLQK